MKQHLTPDQTAKLIELGFDEPKNTQYIQRAKARNLHSPFIEFGEPEFDGSYSMGELIEILDSVSELEITRFGSGWGAYDDLRAFSSEELIDALYEMIIKLKEEGVI